MMAHLSPDAAASLTGCYVTSAGEFGVAVLFTLMGAAALRISARSIVRLWALAVAASIIWLGWEWMAGGGVPGAMDLVRRLLTPLSSTSMELLHPIVFLLVMAPVVNLGLDSMGRGKWRLLCGILSVFVVWYVCLSLNYNISDMARPFTALYLYIYGRSLSAGIWKPRKGWTLGIMAAALVAAIAVPLMRALADAEQPWQMRRPELIAILAAAMAAGALLRRPAVRLARWIWGLSGS